MRSMRLRNCSSRAPRQGKADRNQPDETWKTSEGNQEECFRELQVQPAQLPTYSENKSEDTNPSWQQFIEPTGNRNTCDQQTKGHRITGPTECIHHVVESRGQHRVGRYPWLCNGPQHQGTRGNGSGRTQSAEQSNMHSGSFHAQEAQSAGDRCRK